MTERTIDDTRTALLDYAREWAAGPAERKQSAIQDLLAACRPDLSPMWRWGLFEMLTAATAFGEPEMQQRWLDRLTGGGS